MSATFKTKSIKFTSRAAVKIGNDYFTFEATIEKTCPEEFTDEEYAQQKTLLWDEVNAEIDNQLLDVQSAYKKAKESRY